MAKSNDGWEDVPVESHSDQWEDVPVQAGAPIEAAPTAPADEWTDVPTTPTIMDELGSFGHAAVKVVQYAGEGLSAAGNYPIYELSKDIIEMAKNPSAKFDKMFPSMAGEAPDYFKPGTLEHNKNVAEAFDSGEVTAGQTLISSLIGAKEIYRDPQKGTLTTGLTLLSVGEQALARQTVNLLENMGEIDTSHAKEMLSQEEVHFHDIVDVMWKPKGALNRIARGIVGVGLDIFLDISTYSGKGPIDKIGQGIKVGGRVVDDIAKVSARERQLIRASREIEDVITTEGKFASQAMGEPAENILEENMKLLNQWREGGKLDARSLELNLSGQGNKAVQAIINARQIEKGIIQSIADGEEGMKLYFRIPGTRIAKEFEMPFVNSLIAQPASKGLLGLKKGVGVAFESVDNFLSNLGRSDESRMFGFSQTYDKAKFLGSQAKETFDLLLTKTSRPLFNAMANLFHGDRANSHRELKALESELYNKLRLPDKSIDEDGLNNIRRLLETEPLDSNEALLSRFDKTEDAGAVSRLERARGEAQALREQMSPSQLEVAHAIQEQNRDMINAYRERNIPFEELNPFGDEDWATGYMKHMISREFLFEYKNESEAYQSLYKMFGKELSPKVDKNTLGRLERRSIDRINSERVAAGKVKVFVEDPIEAHLSRMRDMKNILRNHGTLNAIAPLAVSKAINSTEAMPPGYVEFKPEKWGNILHDKEGVPITSFRQFVPEFYDSTRNGGNRVFLPEDVHTRIDWMMNPRDYGGVKLGLGMKALNVFNYLFRNIALYGTGYLGQNLFSNLNTYMYAGGDLSRLVDALRMVLPGDRVDDVLMTFGKGEGALTMTREELYEAMHLFGVISPSKFSEGLMRENMLDNMATSFAKRKTLGEKASTVFDHAMLFSTQRAIAEKSDEIPKIGYFLTKLDEGYTVEGAAEATEFWFYNFRNVSPGQRVASQFVPFSSFAVKTAEQALQNLKRGKIGYMTLSPKVNDALEGAYIEQPEVRRAYNEMVPEWSRDMIHGPLLPGGNEVLLEAPWALSATKMILEGASAHPVFKMMDLIQSAAGQGYSATMDEMSFSKSVTAAADMVLPPPVKQAMIMYQLQHPEEKSLIDYRSKYIPETGFLMGNMDLDKNPAAVRFQSAADFGEWMEKQYGDNAIMNLFFYGTPEKPARPTKTPEEIIYSRKMSGAYGNYMKGFLRDATLGLTRMSPLQNQFLIHHFSLMRQHKGLERAYAEELSNYGSLVVNNPALTEEGRKAVSEKGTDRQKKMVSEMVAIEMKADALWQYMGTVTQDEKEKTGIFRQIFGLEQNKTSFNELPGRVDQLNLKDLSETLFRGMKETDTDLEHEPNWSDQFDPSLKPAPESTEGTYEQ